MTSNHTHAPAPAQPPSQATPLRAGTRVRVTQQVPRRQGHLKTTIEGSVVRYEQSKTGSWYAHGKDDKLWLDRLVLRRDDGEIVHLNLDQYSLIEAV
ncbi:MAG: hypothetical protein Q8L55_12655 [Phycisphaerales bacterium]|nr:hypothetical protein [Phycisphaerales bacterium]